MRNVIFTCWGIFAVGAFALAGVTYSVDKLDRATRLQCATQDWPQHQHSAHVRFCRAYLAER